MVLEVVALDVLALVLVVPEALTLVLVVLVLEVVNILVVVLEASVLVLDLTEMPTDGLGTFNIICCKGFGLELNGLIIGGT